MEQSLTKQLQIIKRGTIDISTEKELKNKLINSIKKNIPLKIKLGLDPSAPDIHLGHTVVLNKMRQFQNLGHQCIIVIGDFTGRIGDPTGKSNIRKQLSKKEVLLNSKTYENQIFKILDKKKTKIIFNSKWFENISFTEILSLASKLTIARILEREDFKNRYINNKAIGIHEIFYPLMQGYDSVVINSDIELGGTDQKFNLLMGRYIQKEYKQKSQIAITMPILEGLDGIHKMSKSFKNYIGINEIPSEIFGKIMSINDSFIVKYFELLTNISLKKINDIKISIKKGENPKFHKLFLAKEIVKFYYNKKKAEESEKNFIEIFSKNKIPNKIKTYFLKEFETYWIPKLLLKLKLVNSTSEGKRILLQGGLKINGKKFLEEEVVIKNKMIIQIGKRKFIKILTK